MTPEEHAAPAWNAACVSWADTTDPSAHMHKACDSIGDRFEDQVDPDGVLDPATRAKRAEYAKKAHYLSLVVKAAAEQRNRKTT